MMDDLQILKNLEGLHVGLLDQHEMKAFNRLCKAGLAKRVYEGAGGFMGLAKVKLLQPLGTPS